MAKLALNMVIKGNISQQHLRLRYLFMYNRIECALGDEQSMQIRHCFGHF